jgi:hypothetical protein
MACSTWWSAKPNSRHGLAGRQQSARRQPFCRAQRVSLANHQPLQPGERLDLHLATYQRPASVLASATAQDTHQTGGTSGCPSRDRLAQLPPPGECEEQGGGPRTGRRKNSSASRGQRNHLERIRRPGDGCQATNSAAACQFPKQQAVDEASKSEEVWPQNSPITIQ